MDSIQDCLPIQSKIARRSFFSLELRFWFVFMLSVGILTFVVRSCFFNWSLITSDSMSPTISSGDIVLSSGIAYDLKIPFTPWRIPISSPKRGDIVVFKSPENGISLVKRIVGVPGDTLSMNQGVLKINGDIINYSSLSRGHFEHLPLRYLSYADFWQESLGDSPNSIMLIPGAPQILRNIPPLTVPEGKYFVLGDNRDFSRDSRMYGFVVRENFTGRTTRVLCSFADESHFKLRGGRFLHALR